ncbi:MAG TPA: hypothetical protein VMV61_03150 [Patescibacteria group bacterium]|nr:hypothetical protein [Patescibacteria group bacterium]
MSIHFSPILGAKSAGIGADLSVQSVDLGQLGGRATRFFALHNFGVRGRPFPPHPHSGFSTITHEFEDWRKGA